MSFEMKISLKNTYAGGQPARKLKSGIYKATIGDCKGRDEGQRAMFVLEIIDDPEMTGLTAVTSMRVPTSSEDKVLHYWRAAAESCGYSWEAINEVTVWTDTHFKGKECFIEYKAGDKKKEIYSEITWLTPSSFRILKKREMEMMAAEIKAKMSKDREGREWLVE